MVWDDNEFPTGAAELLMKKKSKEPLPRPEKDKK